MTDQARSDGLRLSRVMNETQARGDDNTPATPAIAARTRERVRPPRRSRTVPEDDQFTAPVGIVAHGGTAYRISRRVFEMLEEA